MQKEIIGISVTTQTIFAIKTLIRRWRNKETPIKDLRDTLCLDVRRTGCCVE
jgi:hypothetical protein